MRCRKCKVDAVKVHLIFAHSWFWGCPQCKDEVTKDEAAMPEAVPEKLADGILYIVPHPSGGQYIYYKDGSVTYQIK